MKRYMLILNVYLLVSFASSTNETYSQSELPLFEFNVNGIKITAEPYNNFLQQNNNILFISAIGPNGQYIAIEINSFVPKLPPFSIQKEEFPNVINASYYPEGEGKPYYLMKETGKITITQLDTINRTISGEFIFVGERIDPENPAKLSLHKKTVYIEGKFEKLNYRVSRLSAI